MYVCTYITTANHLKNNQHAEQYFLFQNKNQQQKNHATKFKTTTKSTTLGTILLK